ncbi:MAG TPA: hypothetical protein VFL95_03890 [Gemmatimonadales bacterium]|nr:hypothetical protein [Gemmatimonadales bacterium]
MRLIAGVLLASFCCITAPAAAQNQVQVRVAATSPGPTARLGLNQAFNIKLEFTTDSPVRIWARPFFHGKEAPGMSHGSAPHSGTGETLGWFAFREPAQVDEVRISAGGGKPYREWQVISYPVHLEWTADPVSAPAEPEWVARLRSADRAAQEAAIREQMNQPTSPGEDALFSGFMLLMAVLVLAGLGTPIWAARRWSGGWRVAAMIPLGAVAFVVLRIIVGVTIDPTSHNLWPFEIVLVSLAALAAMVLLVVARRIAGAGR